MDINWQEGILALADADSVDHRIVITGDWAPIRGADEAIAADPEGVYGSLLPDLRAADLRITNLECVLGDHGQPIHKSGPNLRTGAAAVAGLRSVPFHVACMANNHSFDFGPDGYRETARLVHEAGLRTVGAGLSEDEAWQPLVLSLGSARVAIVNFGEGEDEISALGSRPGVCGWQTDRVVDAVGRLRDEVDLVLVIPHAGREHPPLPPPYIVDTYRRIAEAGAHAVIAHHPHVPQGVEVHAGAPIFYSTGNFYFHQPTGSILQKLGYAVELCLSDKRIVRARLLPYDIAASGVSALTGQPRQWLLDRVRFVSEKLADVADVRAAQDAFIDAHGPGFLKGQLQNVVTLFDDDPPLGYARLRNVFATPAHQNLFIDATNRLLDPAAPPVPDWAARLQRQWTRKTLEEAMAAFEC